MKRSYYSKVVSFTVAVLLLTASYSFAAGLMYYANPAAADQGVTGTRTIKSLVDAIGSTKKATIVLAHSSSGTNTTYTVSTSVTTTSNISLRIESGALATIATTKALTINGPFPDEGLSQKFNCIGTGAVVWGNQSVDRVDPKWFGAKGDGSTDDSVSIQKTYDSTVSAGRLLYFSAGRYEVNSATIVMTTFKVSGASMDAVILETTANIPIFTIDCTAALYYNSISNLTFVGDVSGTRANNSGILLSGATTAWVAYNQFHHLRFLGTYCGIRVSKPDAGDGSGIRFDWNQFTNIQTANYGLNNCEYAFFFGTGSGTGNVFSTSNLVVGMAGIFYYANAGEIVGDILITNIHFGGNGTGIYGSPGAAYKSAISIMNCQFDAGIDPGVDLDGYGLVKMVGINWPSTNAYNLPNLTTSVIDFDHVSHLQAGITKTVAEGAPSNIYSVTMPVIYYAAYVEITSNGEIIGRGSGITTTRYHINRDAAVSVTVLTNEDTGPGVITHASSVSGNVVTFTVATNSTGGVGIVFSQIKVIAVKCELKRL